MTHNETSQTVLGAFVPQPVGHQLGPVLKGARLDSSGFMEVAVYPAVGCVVTSRLAQSAWSRP